MPQIGEPQNPTGRKPKVKPKKAPKPQPYPTTPNATLGGHEVQRTHAAATAEVDPNSGNLVGPDTKRGKQIRKARQAIKAHAKAVKQAEKAGHQLERASKLSAEMLAKTYGPGTTHTTAKSPDVFIDPQTGRPDHFSNYTPTATRFLNALTGHDPYGSTGENLKNVAINLAETAAPLPAFKAVKAGQEVLRGEQVLKTAQKARKAEEAVAAAKAARKAERTAARAEQASKAAKVKVTAEQFGKQARSRLAKEEAKAAAKRTAARTADRAVRAGTSPAFAAGSVSPGEVGKRTRAFIEGTAEANIPKSAVTTLKTVPGLFTYGATVAAALPQAATGNTKPLSAAAHQGVDALKQFEPYFSGDPEQVKNATENEAGYILAPLAPKVGSLAKGGAKAVAHTAAAKAVGRAGKHAAEEVTGAAKAVRESKPVVKVVPKRPRKAKPGPVRRTKQIVMGHGARKHMAESGDRSMGKAGRKAAMAAKAVDKPASKLGKRHGPEAESLAVVMHVHGVSDVNTMGQLDAILHDHLAHPDDPHIANERKAIEWAQKHPEVFQDKALWTTLARMKEHTEPLVTSESAKYVNQGRVAGVVPRQEMVPAHAAGLTDATTRQGAWDDVNALKAESRELQTKARENRARAKEAAGPRRTQLIKAAQTYERAAKRRAQKADDLQTVLEPYSRPGSKPSPSTKRIDWDAEMQKRFIENVRATRHPDAIDPGFASDKTPHDLVGDMGGPSVKSAGPRVARSKSGSAGAQDIADRSFAGFLQNSVRGPHMQRGVNEFIRGVVKDFKQKIPGTNRYVVKSAREANELITDGLVDPREFVFVPIRHVKQSIKAEPFDLGGYHTAIMDSLNSEINGLEGTPGTKYVLMRREHAIEFADQINPELGGLEAGLSAMSTVGSRMILGTNPAWLEAQFINEMTQSAVAVNPLRTLRSRHTLYQFGQQHPRSAEDFRTLAGESPASLESLSRTHQHAIPNPADAYEAYRYSRKTPVGKFLSDLVTLRTLGKIDRAKSGVIRSHTLAASIDRELNSLPKQAKLEVTHFLKSLANAHDLEYRMTKELQGLSRVEQLKKWTDDPKMESMRRKHLDYLDDVMGNWGAFSRFERRFAPITMFYPYLRMSMRWTFSSYPRRHPIKAQMLYLLGAQNDRELTGLLGHKPNFLETAFPVVYDSEGRLDREHGGVLPGGARFGAPGGNVLVQSAGEGSLSGLTRGLNPILQAGIQGLTGVDAFTGEKQQFEGTLGQQLIGRGLSVARSLLSLPGPLRTGMGPLPETGRIGLGPQSEASKAFDRLDPAKDQRSIFNPFIGLSSQNFHDKSKLSQAFSQSHLGPNSEIAQLYAMVDTYGIDKTTQLLKRQMQGKVTVAKMIPEPPSTGDPAMDKLIKLFYETKAKTSDKVKRAGKPKVRPKPSGGDSIFGSNDAPVFNDSGSGQSVFGHGQAPVFK